jgi:hypothetical protein
MPVLMQGKAMDCILFSSPTLHPIIDTLQVIVDQLRHQSLQQPNNLALATLTIALTANVVMSFANKQHHQHPPTATPLDWHIST